MNFDPNHYLDIEHYNDPRKVLLVNPHLHPKATNYPDFSTTTYFKISYKWNYIVIRF